DDGLSSRTVTASTIVPPVALTISGDDGLPVSSCEDTTTLTARLDEGTISSCTWTSTPAGIVTVPSDTQKSNTATVTASSGGVATVTVNATLADGRVVTQQKTVRVLSLSIPSSDEIMIVGEADVSVTQTSTGYPSTQTYTWYSSDTSVATVDSNGIVHAVSNGNASIIVESSYGGKTVTSNEKKIYVYKVGSITGDGIGFAGDSTNENAMLLNLQIDKPSSEPSGVSISQTWTSGTTTVAANPSTTNISNQHEVKPLKAGTTTISANVSVSCGSVTKSISSPRTKVLTIYGVSIAGNSMLSKTGSYNNLTLTPSLISGSSTYSGSETVTYSLSSSAPSIATTNDSTKKVTAAGVGEATITVTATIGSGANQKVTKATKKVNVIDVTGLTTFIVGEEERALVATTKPSGVTYTWSRTNVTGSATIDSSNGKISATAKGTVTIKLTANRTGNSSDKCEISNTINICEMIIAGITGDSVSLAVGEKLPYKYSFSPAISYTDFQINVNPTGKVNASWIDTNKVFYLDALTTGNTEVTAQLKIDGTQISKKVFTATVESGRNVSISNLSTYLSNLNANDKNHPYKINVTGLSTSNLSQLTTAIQNSSVYVDLSSTSLPSDITDDNDGNGLFYNCSKLVKAPAIPSDVTSMRAWFFGCYNLQTAPTLPNGVTDIWSAFEYCTSLKTPPTLPPNITSMNACFLGCSSLESAPEIPTNSGLKELCSVFSGCVNLKTGPSVIPGNIEDMQGCFNGAGLDGSNTITIYAAIYSSTKWGNAFKDCPNVKLHTFITGSDETLAVKDAIKTATGNDPSKITFE
ncbi:MAG: leucine-rich repeat protein, partial [Treponema sp.]|nr:leucine-rich repeat protein [Treponema sp.]